MLLLRKDIALYSRTLDFQPPIGGIYLRDILLQKAKTMRMEIEQSVTMTDGKVADEDAYINQMIARYSVNVPSLDLTPERTKKTELHSQVHGSELIGQVVIPDRMYRVWEVTFNIPFEGDIELIQYVPRTGGDFGWRPDVAVQDSHIVFQTQTLDVDAEQKVAAIKGQKQRIVTRLQECIDAIKPELLEFNQSVPRNVTSLFESFKQKYQQNKDMLDQL